MPAGKTSGQAIFKTARAQEERKTQTTGRKAKVSAYRANGARVSVKLAVSKTGGPELGFAKPGYVDMLDGEY